MYSKAFNTEHLWIGSCCWPKLEFWWRSWWRTCNDITYTRRWGRDTSGSIVVCFMFTVLLKC